MKNYGFDCASPRSVRVYLALAIALCLLYPASGMVCAAVAMTAQPAAPQELWTHVRNVAEMGELRGMSAEFGSRDSQRVLRLKLLALNQTRYAWASVPAPKVGWELAQRKAVEAEITNHGTMPVKTMLWVVGRHGWDAVGDFATLAPGESRTFTCNLRGTFPDGTPKVDPGQISQIRMMVWGGNNGATLEIRGLKATGEAPEWLRPAGRLDVPDMEEGLPTAGRRVRYQLAGDEATGIYCALYLPEGWQKGGRYPVIAEYPGNIFFGEPCYSTGQPEQCVIGYGMSKGQGTIWVSLPFVDRKAGTIVENGWGNADETADYAVRIVEEICHKFGGDGKNVVLTGFSRGAIACGYIGLRNDRIAPIWKGFHACQHFDGDGWNGSTLDGALERARRFSARPIFHTDNGSEPLRVNANLLRVMSAAKARTTYAQSGLHFHSCAMFLDDRPSTRQLRQWFRELLADRLNHQDRLPDNP